MESGQELKEESGPFSGSSDLGSSDLQETADDLSSGASWTFQRVSVPPCWRGLREQQCPFQPALPGSSSLPRISSVGE